MINGSIDPLCLYLGTVYRWIANYTLCEIDVGSRDGDKASENRKFIFHYGDSILDFSPTLSAKSQCKFEIVCLFFFSCLCYENRRKREEKEEKYDDNNNAKWNFKLASQNTSIWIPSSVLQKQRRVNHPSKSLQPQT